LEFKDLEDFFLNLGAINQKQKQYKIRHPENCPYSTIGKLFNSHLTRKNVNLIIIDTMLDFFNKRGFS
jgi:hypothetical protein